MLLLTYALRNADCHAKNLALRYTSREDVHFAPAYDMVTTAAYPEYQNNSPAISFMGKKTWDPGKNLQTFITATFGVARREQVLIIDQIACAMAEVGPSVRSAMDEHPVFREIGKRMLLAWGEGIDGLRSKRIYDIGEPVLGDAFAGFSDPAPAKPKRSVIGRSALLGGKR